MKALIVVYSIFVFLFLIPSQAHAIIVLPAIAAISIAKIAALVLGFLSLPAISSGVIAKKLTKKSTLTIVALVIILLLAATAIITFFIISR